MTSIIIPSTKSLTVTNKIPNGNINEKNITVGSDGLYTYSSFLFFDISKVPSNAEISNAELVLFKTDNFYKDNIKCIYIYPLFDYFSTFTTYNNLPEINHIIQGSLHPLTSKISVTANLTKIVSLWFRNSLSNKGIILCKKNNDFITSFGSAICSDKYLTPFIKVVYSIKNTIIIHENSNPMKVIYSPCPCNCPSYPNPPIPPAPPVPTIRRVEVTGIVAPFSIYVIIVTLSVTRSNTGHIDNYYVTDQYDNSTSSTPLAIDKFYDIAVIPQENPGDTENISLSGSYKG
ncbi:DNRLRE domain-containing protein [Clostridium estertheticum]|uniref:DNRLRE domain-containing protein n=1 Tax=Clostridium estertheticum TaxID=238834 RepID=A0AA47EKG8_9CLOT|nr:DNRLRE domain-containing protein [Clostridium estertheticum]MBU3157853.1 DNRLRE domain-containing protein [Clostridium estertheticum]WAG60696.1 DNRLRE domain-containing protein [Clostridium estertheticum]